MKKTLVLVLTLAFISCTFPGSNPLDDFFRAREADVNFSGSALVARHGVILLQRGYGYRDRANHVKNTHETKYLIASLSKQFTAAAVLQLCEQDDVDLDATISDYDTRFLHGDEITPRHLLTHTSGYPQNFYLSNYPDPIYDFEDYYTQTVTYGTLDLMFTPGSQYFYSNFGYQTLARLIEISSGTTYHQYVQTQIFNAIGMAESGTEYDVIQDDRLALGYNAVNGDQHLPLFIPTYYSSGAGSLVATVGDLYIWDRALYQHTVISETSTTLMFTGNLNNYGFGWDVQPYSFHGKTYTRHCHSGGWTNEEGGFSSVIYRFPEEELLIVMLCNVKSYQPMFDWLYDILDIVLE